MPMVSGSAACAFIPLARSSDPAAALPRNPRRGMLSLDMSCTPVVLAGTVPAIHVCRSSRRRSSAAGLLFFPFVGGKRPDVELLPRAGIAVPTEPPDGVHLELVDVHGDWIDGILA